MIKVNLLPVKRKRKAKPLPSFISIMVIMIVCVGIILAYLTFFFSSRLSDKKAQYAANETKMAELKEKIKAVEDFEERNRKYKERNDIIEQLSKNKSVPVKILDEINMLLPSGVWLKAMTEKDGVINMEGYAFTNTEIVSYVDNIKGSKMFTEVYLQESKSGEIEKIPLYMFKLTFKVRV